ncbi:MAG: flavin reductase [Dehalococcoidia bacterium]|nr:flavin reductase [Dehalococcoidia bacterium]
MDEAAKNKALRMIPYGLFVVCAQHGDSVAAGAMNWISQTSFKPPLVVLAVKADSRPREVIKEAGAFAVSVLEKGHKEIAQAFFKPAELRGGRLNGYPIEPAPVTGQPILKDAIAWWECRVVRIVEEGDHHLFLGEVVEAGVRREGQPLELRETGFFYGG